MSSKALVILIVSLLYTSMASSFLGQFHAHKREDTRNLASNPSNDDVSRDNNYELLTFTDFLTMYNFSVESSNINISANQTMENNGIITNECYYKVPSEADPDELFCSLTFLTIDNIGQSVQIVSLYLNESKQSTLQPKKSSIAYKGVPSILSSETDSPNNTQTRCKTDVTYYFVNSETMLPFDYVQDPASAFSVAVSLSGGDCGYDVTTSLMTSDSSVDDDKLLPYVGVMVVFGILHMIACERLIKKVERHPGVAKRTSIGSISILLAFDFYIYLMNFKAWTDNSDWLAAIFITFFVVSVFFEPALLYYVFNANRNRRDRPILDSLYDLYFWVLIAGTSLILSLTCMPNCILYVCPFFLMPQIIDNFNFEKKYKWNWWLLIGLGLPKLIFIGYVSFSTDSIFSDNVNPIVLYGGILVVAVQLGVLGVQTKLPKLGFQMKPFSSYSYKCNLEDVGSIASEICSICTEIVSETPLIGAAAAQHLLADHDLSKIMKTPCNHFYHDGCLKEWIKKKLECPNCRQIVPPLEEEDH